MIILWGIVALVFGVAIYFSFQPKQCLNYECFRDNMVSCSKAKYVNEEPEASWGYEVVGFKGKDCEVKVSLLMAKKGELDLLKFEGDSMSCSYPKGIAGYPDRDLSLCTGRLKEDLQRRIIEKLQEYIIDNLGEIKNKTS